MATLKAPPRSEENTLFKNPFLAYKWLGSNTQEFQEDKHTMTKPRVPKDKQEKHKNKKC